MSEQEIKRLRQSLSRPLFEEEEEAAVTPAQHERARAQEDALVAQLLSQRTREVAQRTREVQRRRAALPAALGIALVAALVMLWLPTPLEVPPYELQATAPVNILGGPTEARGKVIALGSGNTMTFAVRPVRAAPADLARLCFVKRDGEPAQRWPVESLLRPVLIDGVDTGSLSFSAPVEALPIIKDWVGASFQVAVVLARPGEHPSLAVVDGILSGDALPRKGWQIASQRFTIVAPKRAGAGPGAAGAGPPSQRGPSGP